MTQNETKIKHSKEYWDVKNSGKRLFYKMKPRQNGEYVDFKLCEDDFNALKSLLGYINRVEKKTILNNQLFAKLYIRELVFKVRSSNTTIFNQYVFNEISNLLSIPLETYYEQLYEDLAGNQLNGMTQENISNVEMQEYVLDYKRFKDTFSLEYVTGKIDEMINSTLHRRS